MSAVFQECAGEEVGAGGFRGVEGGEEASRVSGAEENEVGGLCSVRFFSCRWCGSRFVGDSWESELCRESVCKKVSFVCGVVDPSAVGVLEGRYVESWWFVVKELSVDLPPFL